jgi:hypothetical protein
MAKKARARRSGAKSARARSARPTPKVHKSLRDAQAVFARYFESGGKRVKETFDALAEIFESRHLGEALRISPVRTGRSPRTGGRAVASRSRAAKRVAGKRATASRSTARTLRRKPS